MSSVLTAPTELSISPASTEVRGYVSISQAAALLGVSRVSVSRWIRDGHLPVARLGHRTARIRREDVERFLEQRGLASRGWAGHGKRSAPIAAEPTSTGLAQYANKSETGEATHFVQFYEDDAFLLDAVASFIGAALHGGDVGIVIATAEHQQGIATRLVATGLDLTRATADGLFVALDAEETLPQIMVDGMPDPSRFEAVIGKVVAQAHGRPVRAFGELVALLVGAGNPDAAIRLEQLWNDLAQTLDFCLFCAYPISQFAGHALAGSLHDVCEAHTSVIPAESYGALGTTEEQRRTIVALQQKAQSLEAEVTQRTYAEEQLQLALAERGRLAEAEQAARERAEAALLARDEFLSAAAHELKTPLTSVLANTQLLLRRYERHEQVDPKRVLQALNAIQGQSGKLSRLINQLLDISRLEAGGWPLERQRIDLTRLVEDAVLAASVWSERHSITLSAVPAVHHVLANMDPLRIEQVLNNLLENAIRYSPDDGLIEVTLAQSSDSDEGNGGGGAWVELTVQDHGLGVPLEERGRLFERFYQGHAMSHRSGLGLGLYISRQIVELHGGNMRAEFPAEGGTRMVVRLPI